MSREPSGIEPLRDAPDESSGIYVKSYTFLNA